MECRHLHEGRWESARLVQRLRGTNGASSVTYRLHGDGATILVLGNINPMPQAQIASNITNILVGVGTNPIKASRDAELYRLIKTDGIERALVVYDDTHQPWPSAARLNQMGYELVQHGKVDDAILIFRFNVTAHSSYANGYDSLGEAYLMAGDRSRAIVSYERALELDSSLTSAKAALARLREE